ncbi:MAG TPA: helix-turn-helix transcriptional regulator [Ferruginibacter sp.]|nr:helix-turn-helix transcriptional regulator [Ferruginibacter sp.]HRE62598.1 helix-turn-helix transcriptional regulator [Ferruginibacter sp.]
MQHVKDKDFLKQLGGRIRTIRKSKKMSQVDVGIAMDNFGEQIGRIERGELNVTICTLKKIADTLDTSLSHLLDFTKQ